MTLRVSYVVVVALLCAGLSGCATTTTIVTNPPGATVERDGAVLGQTPLHYTSKMWMWETETVTVTSTSGQTRQVDLKRSELDMVPAAGSLGLVCCFGLTVVGLVGIPLFWAAAFKFPATINVAFDQQPSALSSSGPVVAAAIPRRKYGDVVYAY